MAADKPLQDVYNTVRIPVTDAIISNENLASFPNPSYSDSTFTTNFGCYWNCYPNFFTDRSQNQYSSQFDTMLTKRAGLFNFNTNLPTDATVPFANLTTCVANLCMSNLNDVFVAAIYDSTAALHRIVQYRPSANTSLQIGTLAGTLVTDTVYLSEITIANVATLVVSYINTAETVSTGAYASSAGGVMTAASLTVIADADFPANIAATQLRGQMIQLDGYTFVMSKQGGVYNSDINSITSWNALGVIQANAYPDQGVGLARYKNHVVAFGENSIEFFNDIGNPFPKSPLQRTDQAFIKFGSPFGKCIIAVDDTLYWWAKSESSKWGLYKLDGYTPVKVSSLREDVMAMSQNVYPELYYLFDRGKQHIISTIRVSPALLYYGENATANLVAAQPSADAFTGDPYSLSTSSINGGYVCWDLQTGAWWIFGYEKDNSYFPVSAANFSTPSAGLSLTSNTVLMSYNVPRTIVGLAGLANQIYGMGASILATQYCDFADTAPSYRPITAGVQFNVWDFGNEKRKAIHRLKVIQTQPGATNSGIASPGTTPYTWVIYNKTEGNYYSFIEASPMTRIFRRPIIQNERVFRTYLNNLGTARKWYIGIIQKSDMPFELKGIELDISQRG